MRSVTNGITNTYGYDRLNRLTSGAGYTYDYDNAGNMTGFTVSGVARTNAFDAANQLCWRVSADSTAGCSTPPAGAVTFDYDGAGNLTTTSNGWRLAYNAKNQATSIAAPGQAADTANYADVGMAERVSFAGATYTSGPLGVTVRTAGGATTRYTRDPAGRIVAERTPGGATYYYFTDGQHNVRDLFTASGTIAARYGYGPYGDEVTSPGPNAEVYNDNPWRFAGGESDGNTLYHFGARYYNTAGQWWQQDAYPGQLTRPNSTNRFAYDGDNPITNIHPPGRHFLSVFEGIDLILQGLAALSYSVGIPILAYEAGASALALGLVVAPVSVALAAAGIALIYFGYEELF